MVGAPFERAVAPIRSATVKNGRYVRRTGYRAYHVHSLRATRVHSLLLSLSLSILLPLFLLLSLALSHTRQRRFLKTKLSAFYPFHFYTRCTGWKDRVENFKINETKEEQRGIFRLIVINSFSSNRA